MSASRGPDGGGEAAHRLPMLGGSATFPGPAHRAGVCILGP